MKNIISCPIFAGKQKATFPFQADYRGTSLIRNNPSLGRLMPRALWWSYGGGFFLVSEVPLYMASKRARQSDPARTQSPRARKEQLDRV